MLKISVKGSKDKKWGLTQKYLKNSDYHKAADMWLAAHHKKTIFCLVQFSGTEPNEMPKIYLATPKEIADRLKESACGRGETILFENHRWSNRAYAKGTTDSIPKEWLISEERLNYLFETYGQ